MGDMHTRDVINGLMRKHSVWGGGGLWAHVRDGLIVWVDADGPLCNTACEANFLQHSAVLRHGL